MPIESNEFQDADLGYLAPPPGETGDPDALTVEDVAGICASEIEAARRVHERTGDGNATADKSAMRAMDYFNGVMRDTPPAPGFSQVQSSDIADVIGWMMPGLMRIFFSSDRFADFEPQLPEDEETAGQVSDYLNYIFLRECNGYKIGWNAMHDALLLRTGVIKFWWDATPTFCHFSFSGLDDAAFATIVNEPDVEILEHNEYTIPLEDIGLPEPEPMPPTPPMPQDGGMPPEAEMPPPGPNDMGMGQEAGPMPPMGPDAGPGLPGPGEMGGVEMMPSQMPQAPMLDAAPPPPMFHDLKIRKLVSGGKPIVAAVPPEEFLIDSKATDIRDARFCCHWSRVTRSELVRQGFDKERVFELSAGSEYDTDSFRFSRRNSFGDSLSIRTDAAMEVMDRYECYLQADMDGDGVAEWLQVVMAGGHGVNNLLSVKHWGDPVPFAVLKPYFLPHEYEGRSIADDVIDVQQRKTVLYRQILNNLYLTNHPQRVVVGREMENLDEVTNIGVGGVLRVKNDVNAVRTEVVPFVAGASFQALEYEDSIVERRTGISRATMALDPEALVNQTATAVQKQADAAYSKIELVARNFAEGGFADLMRGLLKIVVKHQDRARVVRLRGEWVAGGVDPRSWNADMDVTINTGIGSGSKDRDLTSLQNIFALQKDIITMAGTDNPIVPPQNLVNTLIKMVEMAGIRNPEQFFHEMNEQERQAFLDKVNQPPPDPKAEEAQAKLQLEQQKFQQQVEMDKMKAQQDLQLAQMKMQQDLEIARQNAMATAQLEQARMQAEIEIQKTKLQNEFQLRVQEMQLEAQLKREQMRFMGNMPGDETNIIRPE